MEENALTRRGQTGIPAWRTIGDPRIWIDLLTRLPRRNTIVRYEVVGGIGYIVYAGLHSRRRTIGDLFATQRLWSAYSSVTPCGRLTRTIDPDSAWLHLVEFEARALVSTQGILTVAVDAAVMEVGTHHYVALPIGLALASPELALG